MPSPIRTAKRVDGVSYAVRDVVLTARKAAEAGKDLIFMNIGDPCQFGFRTPPHIVEAIARALRDNQTFYAPSEGTPEAIEAIRRDAVERKGIRDPLAVFVGHGASEPIELLLTALVEPGEGVLVPSPGYPLYSAILGKLEARAQAYHLDEERGWAPDPDEIEALVDAGTRALVLINPNNPTGSVAPRAVLERVLDVAARHGLVVLSDEIYDRMLLDEVDFVSTASLRDDVVVATFGGLSKVWLGPGLRLGWAIFSGPEVAAKPLLDAMGRLLRARLCASHPVQHAVPAALEGPQEHIAETNRILRRRRDLLVERLRDLPGWSLTPPQGAFYAFPRLDLGRPDAEVVRELILEQGVVLVHGSGFGQRAGTQHARMVFLPPEDVLEEALRRIRAYTEARLG
ncbi:MAG: aminotransferase class I/II-fold pyridoxal phosphate-dependent enzyme [Planctomycetota bacterium]|nr:MAG: aminotransferase class I/II-fold pyridoxal phosphate-dependent enzyme [Planctomycetota bacterium]